MHASPPGSTPPRRRGEEGQRSFACISSGITTVIRVTCGAIKGTITDLMSHSQFHCTVRVHLDLHGLIFETSICYWQDQPGSAVQKNTQQEREARSRPLDTPFGPQGVRGGVRRRRTQAGAVLLSFYLFFSSVPPPEPVSRVESGFLNRKNNLGNSGCDFRRRRFPLFPVPRNAASGENFVSMNRFFNQGPLRHTTGRLRLPRTRRTGRTCTPRVIVREIPSVVPRRNRHMTVHVIRKANPRGRGGAAVPNADSGERRPGRRLPQAGLVFRSASKTNREGVWGGLSRA